MASENVTDRLAVVDTPVAELAGTVPVTVGAVKSPVVKVTPKAEARATPLASVAEVVMLRV